MLPLVILLACRGPADDTDPNGDADTDADSDSDTDTDTDTAADHSAAFEKLRKKVERDLADSYATGAQVAIWYDGEIIFSEGFGSAHPDEDVPVTPTTLFQIGSDTKKLTALALLQQAEAGRLSIDDTLAEALPELTFARDPSWSEDMTLHHLLSHQTSLYDYTPWDHAPDDGELAARAYGRFAENEYRMGAPGLFWNYSNPNFSLAGLATEEADGRPWADVLEDDVFAPLGMTRSFARLEDVAADGEYATGYGLTITNVEEFEVLITADMDYTVGTVEMADQVDNAYTRPAGLVWATAEDMVKVGAFLIDGDTAVLSDASRAAITTGHVGLYPGVDPADLGYGYGVMTIKGFYASDTEFYETPLWQHGGNTLTMTSAFYVLPEARLAVSILSNGYGDDFTRTAVVALTEIAELPEPIDPPSLLEPPENLDAYAGTWEDPYGVGTIDITWDGSDLRIDMPDLEAAGVDVADTLTPYAKDLFLVTIDGYAYDIRFYDGGGGEPDEYIVNRLFVARKWTAPEAAPPPVRPLSAAAFELHRRSPTLPLLPRVGR